MTYRVFRMVGKALDLAARQALGRCCLVAGLPGFRRLRLVSAVGLPPRDAGVPQLSKLRCWPTANLGRPLPNPLESRSRDARISRFAPGEPGTVTNKSRLPAQ